MTGKKAGVVSLIKNKERNCSSHYILHRQELAIKQMQKIVCMIKLVVSAVFYGGHLKK